MRTAVFVVAAACWSAAPTARSAVPGKHETVTVSIAPSATADGDSFGPTISKNGRFVAFASNATNLTTAPPGNGLSQAMVFDRKTGRIELVSRNGLFPDDSGCNLAVISPNGRFVAISSKATDLVPGANGKSQVYRIDRKTHEVLRVSQDGVGAAANQDSFVPFDGLSNDGRFILFTSAASNLTAAGGNGKSQAYRRDMKTGVVTLISATPAGGLSGADCSDARISENGRFVAFSSFANDVTTDDHNAAIDVFVRDLKHASTRLVSKSATGAAADAACGRPSISGNGRFVAFSSAASTLVPGDSNGVADAFVVDLRSGKLQRFSVELADEHGEVGAIDLSRTGAKLAVDVNEPNGAGPGDDLVRAFLVTRKSGKSIELTVDPAGDSAPWHSPPPPLCQLSGNAKLVVFQSPSPDIGADADSQIDCFLRRP